MTAFLTRTRGRKRLHWTDWMAYAYLTLGVLLMFGPVLWLVLSSFKTERELQNYPPRLLPYVQKMETVPGYDKPLPIYKVTAGPLAGQEVAQIRRIGLISQVVKPSDPKTVLKVPFKDRKAVEHVALATSNYSKLFERFNFFRFFYNSTFITVMATLITLLVNSMAAFALSKYQFRGRGLVMALIIGTLMIPPTVVLVPLFLIVRDFGMIDSLWGVIIPGAATPTGVFLLRQYMLTIPDEILDAARMDKASEWKIYWRIILPLSAPAIAVLAILSIMWRWNDFLWPLIALQKQENFTLQLALNSFRGEFTTDWASLLAMTVLTLVPIVVVFAFLQKYIATGIASTGGK
ncbi:carbohydrate ABC transporter permease [Thioclava sp. BHET1]|uniref:ABC transporter permease n=1 Tax=Thioclava dalianensis TaxID=1185766 RepID=A0A074U915_9RHOB|nr:carbohydrate ABC transporter permease [Thioclava dalianensis]KEP71172.1 ABC transporter permease [Thioclava dalianensis]TMV93278.1 carbohydrate ABC transporter permease [Thioclava sp. BHET1]SFN23426.1 alpha-1,4-digalacturonate transport system permease protein [Thioclava dalianensis]